MIGGVLGMGRRMAESRMTEKVTVGKYEMARPPGSLDPVITLVETYYSGKARVKFPTASAAVQATAGQQVVETSIVVSLPSAAALVPTGAFVVVEGSLANPNLVGRRFRVSGPGQSGQTTADRYPVVEES